ncbi:MAG TPA: apolipoprotein N-acyltransferase [Polyangia bacterium]|nr:apolipoprotein N-acyltransferase [Polyangia bacterium]
MGQRTRTALAAAAGALLFLSLPPAGWWWLTLPALVAVGFLWRGATARQAFRSGWIVGFVATAGVGYWLPSTIERFTGLTWGARLGLWFLLAAWTGLSWGLAGGAAGWLGKTIGYPVAAALGLLVFERWGPTIFSYPIAVALVDAPWIAQSADLIGVPGLGALAVLVAVAAAESLTQRRVTRTLAIGLALTAALTGYGALRGRQVARAREAAPKLLVGLVQPAIPAAARWEDAEREQILAHLQTMTSSLLAQQPELLVWHEGAYPYRLAHAAGHEGGAVPSLMKTPGVPPLIFGAQTDGDDGARYNSAFLRTADGVLSAPVDKRVRVAFGEYIPLLARVGFLRRAFPRVEGLRSGDRPELLSAGGRTYGVLNCLEDIIPTAGAEVAGADLLVNLTNDAWFDGAEGAQHLVQARWRAIETRRDLVRAVNSGQTGLVDALGRVVVAMPADQPAVLVVGARVATGLHALAPTVIPFEAWLALAALAFAAALKWRRGRSTTA